MIEKIFTELTIALSGDFFLALAAALGWGVLSILLSPCHLSSIPLVIGYINNQGKIKIKHSFYIAITFAFGILITIAVIGVITASMGRLMGDVGVWGNWIVAAVFIIIGLYLMDILRFDWNRLPMNTSSRGGLWGAFILGLIFGIGLGPCTFAFLAPVLAVVFQTAGENWVKSMLLLSAFAIGHCSIIAVAGSLTGLIQKYINWNEHSKALIILKRTTGILVIFSGLYFIFML